MLHGDIELLLIFIQTVMRMPSSYNPINMITIYNHFVYTHKRIKLAIPTRHQKRSRILNFYFTLFYLVKPLGLFRILRLVYVKSFQYIVVIP